jgi:hypothetical protein
MKITAKVIVSIAAAAAAGVAIGMLIAPEKGDELQKKIAKGAREWLGELTSLLVAGKSTIEEAKPADAPQLEESNNSKKMKQTF